MKAVISGDFAGTTVKDWLYANKLSRALITRLKKHETGILLNGSKVTVRHVLCAGDVLDLATDDLPRDENEGLIPIEMPLDILYEDDRMIALNKPAGIPTHPSHGHFDDTLANGLAAYYKARGIPFIFRAINRLDRETSGVVLVAKSQYSASLLTGLMLAGKIRKTYLALLNGVPNPPAGSIGAPIRRREATIILREASDFAVAGTDGYQDALTLYDTLADDGAVSIIRARPVTGRTHQLRVHFAHLGVPIIGDGLYGYAEHRCAESGTCEYDECEDGAREDGTRDRGTPDNQSAEYAAPTTCGTVYDREIGRHALHALSLSLDFGDNTLELTAKLPADMQRLCNKIKGAEFSVETW